MQHAQVCVPGEQHRVGGGRPSNIPAAGLPGSRSLRQGKRPRTRTAACRSTLRHIGKLQSGPSELTRTCSTLFSAPFLHAVLQKAVSVEGAGRGGMLFTQCPGNWTPFLTTAQVEYFTVGVRSDTGEGLLESLHHV